PLLPFLDLALEGEVGELLAPAVPEALRRIAALEVAPGAAARLADEPQQAQAVQHRLEAHARSLATPSTKPRMAAVRPCTSPMCRRFSVRRRGLASSSST